MDNKITKKRLYNLLSYEWILMCFIIAAAMIAWELIYTIGAVRLTPGQQFKYYLDQSIYMGDNVELFNLVKDDDALSYDVLKFDTEALISGSNVLATRLTIYDGDIIFTDSVGSNSQTKKNIRAKEVVDLFSIYPLEDLVIDAQKYLKDNFLTDGITAENAELEYENLSKEKIKNVFLNRMKGDNRFRTEQEKADGIKLEEQRIEKLCAEIKDFKKFLNHAINNQPELLYRYTKYEQVYDNSKLDGINEEDYAIIYHEEEQRRPNAIYGINVAELKGGTDPSNYVKVENASDAKDVVMMAFNFLEQQPHLQFEVISFMNTIIRTCSNII